MINSHWLGGEQAPVILPGESPQNWLNRVNAWQQHRAWKEGDVSGTERTFDSTEDFYMADSRGDDYVEPPPAATIAVAVPHKETKDAVKAGPYVGVDG